MRIGLNLRSVSTGAFRSLLLLREAGLTIAPHIVAGLHYGRMIGESKALQLIAEADPDAFVLVVLTSFPGTPMENVKPPPIKKVVRLMREARARLPDAPILLGCARPRGPYGERLDKFAVELGFDGIAYPSQEARRRSLENGLRIESYPLCCSLITKLDGLQEVLESREAYDAVEVEAHGV